MTMGGARRRCAVVEDVDRVTALELRRGARLGHEAALRLLAVGVLLIDELDGDLGAERRVAAFPDRAHAAMTDESQDLVLAGSRALTGGGCESVCIPSPIPTLDGVSPPPLTSLRVGRLVPNLSRLPRAASPELPPANDRPLPRGPVGGTSFARTTLPPPSRAAGGDARRPRDGEHAAEGRGRAPAAYSPGAGLEGARFSPGRSTLATRRRGLRPAGSVPKQMARVEQIIRAWATAAKEGWGATSSRPSRSVPCREEMRSRHRQLRQGPDATRSR